MKIQYLIVVILILLHVFNVFKNLETAEIKTISEEEMIKTHAPPNLQTFYYISKYSKQYNVPLEYVLKSAYLETGYKGFYHWDYNPFSEKQISVAGARGPLQVMYICALDVWGDSIKHLSKNEVHHYLRYDLEWNIHTGIRHMRRLYDKYKDWKIVYSVYNQGWVGEKNINNYALRIAS